MRILKTIIVMVLYYAAIIAAGIWYDFRVAALVIAGGLCVAVVCHLIDEENEDEEEEEAFEHDSCDGCIHNLGGGCCSITVEHECREGGGFELYTEELR